ncbi:MAG: folylpolyglutamate synthase/dihydrofolate synthase family protein [Hyphomonadaceae bacterium]
MRAWRVPYPKFGAGPGLERVAAVAARLGVDPAQFGGRGAVIVGSNGKGSTAAMTAALLQADGPVGLFTSPHLLDLNERFRINDDDIGDAALAHHWERVDTAVRDAGVSDELGGFEFLFLIALDWFAAQDCRHTVWEAGIGGRLDPVRLIEARALALTALDLEHTQLLGETLPDIARDKLDAAPTGARVFVSESCEPVRAEIEAHCLARGVEAVFVAAEPALASPLVGAHQGRNAALAVALAQRLAPDVDISAGLARTRWPGRLERLGIEPLVVIDVGHTPDAVRQARAEFDKLAAGAPRVLVCGVSADKDARVIVSLLAPGFARIICVAARHKGAPAAEIASHAQAANPDAEITLAETVEDARRLALSKASGGAIYVAGGLFLAAEFRAIHLGRDPAGLAFF